MIKRKSYAVAVVVLSLAFGAEARPLVGAIRWDAWSGVGKFTKETERSLAPEKHRPRMPWFAQVNADGTVRIHGAAPGIMEKEIDYAADAGLDYWAFVLYAHDLDLSDGLHRFLAAPNRSRMHFAVILHNHKSMKTVPWPQERDLWLSYLQQPNYQRLADGRPLVFAFAGFPDGMLADFRRAAASAGLNPYCAYMGNLAQNVEKRKAGYDAFSSYAWGDNGAKTFKELADGCERNLWKKAADGRIPLVPLVTTGWNNEPRKDNPVSWLGGIYQKYTYFTPWAKPGEIAEHLKRGIAFVETHRGLCPANAILIYAWNEHDEGGWLCPTWTPSGKPDTSRLDALRPILRGE